MASSQYGRLTIIKTVTKNGEKLSVCKCACGRLYVGATRHIIGGSIQSCGCKKRDFIKQFATKHGLSKTGLYAVWEGIKRRCYNKNYKFYKNYGARGITVCEEWLRDPDAFCKWALSNGYAKGLTLDRIDNDGPYSPKNCRWATKREQARNTRNNIWLTANNKTKLLCDWAKELGVAYQTIRYHMAHGKTFEQIYKERTKHDKK